MLAAGGREAADPEAQPEWAAHSRQAAPARLGGQSSLAGLRGSLERGGGSGGPGQRARPGLAGPRRAAAAGQRQAGNRGERPGTPTAHAQDEQVGAHSIGSRVSLKVNVFNAFWYFETVFFYWNIDRW